MNTIYEKNLSYMKEHMPLLYQNYSMRFSEKDMIDQRPWEFCVTNGYPNIKIHHKYVHSKYNPHTEGKLISLILDSKECDTIFIMGIGMGYHLAEIIENYPDKNKIFYEPNLEIFREFLSREDISQYNQKNVLFIVDDIKENVAEQMISLFMSLKIYRVTFAGLPTYVVEYDDIWDYITKEFLSFFTRYTINVKTSALYRNQWIINYFKNLRHYPYESDFNDYIGKFKGVPGVIVSSGPSLTKNVHLLKNIMDKALIVSAGSSINALQDRNITPHVMLGVDGSQLMSDEYNAVKDDTILFAHIMNTHYDCIDRYKGPKMHIRVNSESHIEYFEKINKTQSTVLKTGGSCANVAMDFLVKLGCDPIILIGQDLCFTDNVTHAEGVWDRRTVDLKEVQQKEKAYILTKDIYGNPVYTNKAFASMHKWFEEYIRETKKQGVNIHVINATEGGLFIQGAEHKSFQEAIEEYCVENKQIREALESIHKKSITKVNLKKKHVINFLTQVTKEMERLEKWSKLRSKRLLQVFERLKHNNSRNADIRKKINRITIKMESKDIYYYMIWQPCHDIIYSIKNRSEKEMMVEQDIVKKLEILYKGLEQQYNEIHMRIQVIKNAVTEALEEIKGWNA